MCSVSSLIALLTRLQTLFLTSWQNRVLLSYRAGQACLGAANAAAQIAEKRSALLFMLEFIADTVPEKDTTAANSSTCSTQVNRFHVSFMS